jgi:hypothetical protein
MSYVPPNPNRRAPGFSPLTWGFVALIVAVPIITSIACPAKSRSQEFTASSPTPPTIQVAPNPNAGLSDSQIRDRELRRLGLDPSHSYPWFPLVWGDLGSYGSTITGTVRNYSDINYRLVSITLECENEMGEIVGNAYDSVDGIGARKTWRFDCRVPRGTAKYHVKEISSISE